MGTHGEEVIDIRGGDVVGGAYVPHARESLSNGPKNALLGIHAVFSSMLQHTGSLALLLQLGVRCQAPSSVRVTLHVDGLVAPTLACRVHTGAYATFSLQQCERERVGTPGGVHVLRRADAILVRAEAPHRERCEGPNLACKVVEVCHFWVFVLKPLHDVVQLPLPSFVQVAYSKSQHTQR